MVGANDLTAAYAQCGTWDSNDYYGAAATIAQQYARYILLHADMSLDSFCHSPQKPAPQEPGHPEGLDES